MQKIIAAITALVAKITSPVTVQPLRDRAAALVSEIDAEAKAAYEKAEALNELASQIALKAKHERNYATEAQSLAGRLESAII